MKEYPSVLGIKQTRMGVECIATDKMDGSQIRVEWTKKTGYSKFGTCRRLLQLEEELALAIPVFREMEVEIEKVRAKHKKIKQERRLTFFFEFYGMSSFAGQHDFTQPMVLSLFDVALDKKGFMTPHNFEVVWGDSYDVLTPSIRYVGKLNKEFVERIRRNTMLDEGVVAKGLNRKGNIIWRTKIKTQRWLDRLKREAATNQMLVSALRDNKREQG